MIKSIKKANKKMLFIILLHASNKFQDFFFIIDDI